MSDDLRFALSHLLEQTRANIAALVSLNQVSAQDADAFLSKLPEKPTSTSQTRSGLASSGAPSLFKARAKWGYNENGKEVNDLSFNAGDIIDIVDHSNGDWWRGQIRGREGLLPSSYVERIPFDRASRPVPPPPSSTYYNGPPLPNFNPNNPPFPPYMSQQQPPPPPQQNYYVHPPPQFAPYPPYGGSAPPQQPPPPVVVNSGDNQGKKPGILSGGLGNTLAHSAVGGAGFGAGSALAGGLVNSIF